jgi:hypothetical protein
VSSAGLLLFHRAIRILHAALFPGIPKRGYGWLNVKCRRCQTEASIPLEHVRRPRNTLIWKLESALKCRSCRTPRYSPPVHMIKPTENPRDHALRLGTSRRQKDETPLLPTFLCSQREAGPEGSDRTATIFATQLANIGRDWKVSEGLRRSLELNKINRFGMKAHYSVQAPANSKTGGRRFEPCHSCQ